MAKSRTVARPRASKPIDAPRLAKRRATARPTPAEAPVIITTCGAAWKVMAVAFASIAAAQAALTKTIVAGRITVVDVHARLYPQRQAASELPLILLTHTAAGVIGLKVD